LHKTLFNERDEHVLKAEVYVKEDNGRVAKNVEKPVENG
jgi:hypothetical protein